MVGRTPWSAADALVGLPQWYKCLILRARSGTRASRADRGVRPTNPAAFHLLGLTGGIRHSCRLRPEESGRGRLRVCATVPVELLGKTAEDRYDLRGRPCGRPATTDRTEEQLDK